MALVRGYAMACHQLTLVLFVCVEVLRPSQPKWVMLSMVSLPYHTFTGQV